MKKLLIMCAVALCAVFPAVASAHQPRIVTGTTIDVREPEVSKAYYGELTGDPHVFRIVSDRLFSLYVQVLVPDRPGQKRDISAVVIRDGNVDHPAAVLNGESAAWTHLYEPFGADWYWQGPEFRMEAPPGTYEIRVWSSNNDSRYTLVLGETESFPPAEGIKSLLVLPVLKRDFFGTSPLTLLKSPFGYGEIALLFVLAAALLFVFRSLIRRITPNERLVRISLALVLLVFAITTSWNPFVIMVSGILLFEGVSGRSVLYV